MRISFVTVIGVVCVAMGVAHAAQLTAKNSKWGYETTYPDGWIVGQSEKGPIYTTAVAPPPEAGVLCNTTAEKIGTTGKMSQIEINGKNGAPFGRAFWLTNVYKSFQNIEFELDRARKHNSGINVQEAIASFDTVEDGVTYRAKAHTAIWIAPGMTYSITCLGLAAKFEKHRNDYASVIDSFRSNGGLSASVQPEGPKVELVNFDPSRTATGASAGIDSMRLH